MDTVNVQFESEERKIIVAEFSSAQDASFWGNQGVVSRDDERYTQFKIIKGPVSIGETAPAPALKRAFSFLRS
jgi:predicted CoA-binding protein